MFGILEMMFFLEIGKRNVRIRNMPSTFYLSIGKSVALGSRGKPTVSQKRLFSYMSWVWVGKKRGLSAAGARWQNTLNSYRPLK